MSNPGYVKEKLLDLPVLGIAKGTNIFVLEKSCWYFFNGQNWEKSKSDFSLEEMVQFFNSNSGIRTELLNMEGSITLKLNDEIKKVMSEIFKVQQNFNLGLKTIESKVNELHNITNHIWLLCKFNNNMIYDESGNYRDIISNHVSFYNISKSIQNNLQTRNNNYNSCLNFETLNGQTGKTLTPYIQFDGFTFEECTIEFWINNYMQPYSDNGYTRLITGNNPDSSLNFILNIYGDGYLTIQNLPDFISTTSIKKLLGNYSGYPGTWIHVALCLKNQQLLLFINGQLDSTINYPYPITTGTKTIFGSVPTSKFTGFLSDLRISDICQYSQNFIPPLSF